MQCRYLITAKNGKGPEGNYRRAPLVFGSTSGSNMMDTFYIVGVLQSSLYIALFAGAKKK